MAKIGETTGPPWPPWPPPHVCPRDSKPWPGCLETTGHRANLYGRLRPETSRDVPSHSIQGPGGLALFRAPIYISVAANVPIIIWEETIIYIYIYSYIHMYSDILDTS